VLNDDRVACHTGIDDVSGDARDAQSWSVG